MKSGLVLSSIALEQATAIPNGSELLDEHLDAFFVGVHAALGLLELLRLGAQALQFAFVLRESLLLLRPFARELQVQCVRMLAESALALRRRVRLVPQPRAKQLELVVVGTFSYAMIIASIVYVNQMLTVMIMKG